MLAAADPAYTAELRRQLLATGRARVWVPASRPLAEMWVPGADLRDVLALPVLVVAGHGAANWARPSPPSSTTSPTPRSTSIQEAPSGLDEFESRTVALLNRGVPGFAVETDGTLHTSLMRSCTGWPSGVWIDPPAAHRAGRLQLPAPALDAHLRLRADVCVTATGVTVKCRSAVRNSITRWCAS